MSSVLCINAVHHSDYASMALADGYSAVDRLRAFAQTLSGIDQVVVLTGEAPAAKELPDQWRRERRSEWNDGALLETLGRLDAEEIVYVRSDVPFINAALTEQMRHNHKRYFAEYSFAEGYPAGVTPEILSSQAAQRILAVCRSPEQDVDQDSLFRALQNDINAFDIETALSPVDCRMLRLELFCDNKRNYLLCKRLVDVSGVENVEALLETVHARGDLLRTLPAFVSLQLVDASPQQPLQQPEEAPVSRARSVEQELSVEKANRLARRIGEFAPESMLHVSLWGEVGLHSDPEGVIKALAGQAGMQLLVETSGVGWRDEVAQRCAAIPGVTWIVALDAADESLYGELRGEGFSEAQRFAGMLFERAPERTYVQATRMEANEEHLQNFYESWSDRTDRIIVQKYDHFNGRLPDRRVSDISPLVRMPCWHLKRDLYILLDGTVPLCREDLDKEHVLGNAFNEELATIWERGQRYHERHVAEDYPALCASCDEYYTFNN